MTGPRFPERDAAVVAEYLRGDRIADIQKRHNIRCATMYFILDRNGIERRGQPDLTPKPNKWQQQVLDMYAAGVSRYDIFQKFPQLEANQNRLDQLCHTFGVKRPEGHRREKGMGTGRSMSAGHVEMILKMYKPGITPIQRIADKTRLSYETIRHFLIRQGIYKPVPSGLYSKFNQPKRKADDENQ
jgi:hypothetical protein